MRAASMAFYGFPRSEDFDDLDDAVALLQELWDILDDWPGDGNVQRFERMVNRGRDGCSDCFEYP